MFHNVRSCGRRVKCRCFFSHITLLETPLRCKFKLKFHEAVFLVASSWHPREDVRNKSCVSCSWTSENDTDTQTNGQHYTAADRRPTNQVSAWQAGRGSRRKRPTRTACYGHPREKSRGCCAENVPWNISFTHLHYSLLNTTGRLLMQERLMPLTGRYNSWTATLACIFITVF